MSQTLTTWLLNVSFPCHCTGQTRFVADRKRDSIIDSKPKTLSSSTKNKTSLFFFYRKKSILRQPQTSRVSLKTEGVHILLSACIKLVENFHYVLVNTLSDPNAFQHDAILTFAVGWLRIPLSDAYFVNSGFVSFLLPNFLLHDSANHNAFHLA